MKGASQSMLFDPVGGTGILPVTIGRALSTDVKRGKIKGSPSYQAPYPTSRDYGYSIG
ncbi:MAG: hypothetical protein F6J90_22295 [Moorea sp. SIOASIH]|nr:hypothetical protein [Moorena sp. SIOASIH]